MKNRDVYNLSDEQVKDVLGILEHDIQVNIGKEFAATLDLRTNDL